jgi:hypothetical protein
MLAMGLTPVNPLLDPIEDLPLRGLSWVDAPVVLNAASAKATAVFCEYRVPNTQAGMPAYDGHFVVMNHPAAIFQANMFLGSHARMGYATLAQYPFQ